MKNIYYLFALDFHMDGFDLVGDVTMEGEVVTQVPSITEILKQITERELKWHNGESAEVLDVKFEPEHIYATDTKWIPEVFGNIEKWPHQPTVTFVQSIKDRIICAYGVDWDESDTYIVVKYDVETIKL